MQFLFPFSLFCCLCCYRACSIKPSQSVLLSKSRRLFSHKNVGNFCWRLRCPARSLCAWRERVPPHGRMRRGPNNYGFLVHSSLFFSRRCAICLFIRAYDLHKLVKWAAVPLSVPAACLEQVVTERLLRVHIRASVWKRPNNRSTYWCRYISYIWLNVGAPKNMSFETVCQ